MPCCVSARACCKPYAAKESHVPEPRAAPVAGMCACMRPQIVWQPAPAVAISMQPQMCATPVLLLPDGTDAHVYTCIPPPCARSASRVRSPPTRFVPYPQSSLPAGPDSFRPEERVLTFLSGGTLCMSFPARLCHPRARLSDTQSVWAERQAALGPAGCTMSRATGSTFLLTFTPLAWRCACVRACMRACVRACVHACVKASVHVCTCINVYMYIHGCTCVYMYKCIHVYTWMHMHTHIYLWSYSGRAYVQAPYIQVHAHTCGHTHTSIYTYMRTRVRTPTHRPSTLCTHARARTHARTHTHTHTHTKHTHTHRCGVCVYTYIHICIHARTVGIYTRGL